MKPRTLLLNRLLVVLIVLTLSGCQWINNSEDDKDIVSKKPDNTGNLLVNNELDEAIYLYRGNEILKEIPPHYVNFLILIPTQGGGVSLSVWKKADVEDIYNPPADKLFRTWDVVLSTSDSPSQRVTWTIL